MSKYGFAIKNAGDLLTKAKFDADRINRTADDPVKWSYAAFDYIQTAWHLADWLAKESGKPLSEVRQDIDSRCDGMYSILGDIACGQKHWQRDGGKSPQKVIAKTTAPAMISTAAMTTVVGVPIEHKISPFVIGVDGQKIHAHILIRDTVDALEAFAKSAGTT